MENIRITINIAGRSYPLTVPAAEEEALRRVGKQIDRMIKDFENNFSVRDKQDALAMCALRLGADAETSSIKIGNTERAAQERLGSLHRLLDSLEK